ncbi:cytochrome P450 [Streptomyces sp. NPDC021093]|uniref:cytochrome P450 n=1 Tax=Streptomyces sp. NPDC021093 TaxID=3365112 RepID=UPI0037B62764
MCTVTGGQPPTRPNETAGTPTPIAPQPAPQPGARPTPQPGPQPAAQPAPQLGPQPGPLPGFLPSSGGLPDVVRIQAPTGDRLWLVTRFGLGRAVLTDDRFSRAAAVVATAPAAHPMRPDPDALTSLDAPAHTRLRRLVNRAFTPAAVAAHEDGIRSDARALLAGRERFDLVREFAMPLAAATICRVLGVPPAERGRFTALADRALGLAAPEAGGPPDVPAAQRELRRYFAALVAQARRAPGPHLLGALVRARDDGAALSEPELTSLVELLLNAGYETTTGQLALSVLLLLQNPREWQYLTRHREAVPGAVEELLRYAPVVPISFTRVARQDVNLAGATVRAGEAVLVSLLHANFDPDANTAPDQLSVRRASARHLTLGHGAHVCLGAQLARIQLTVAIEELTRTAPDLRLDTDAGADTDADVLDWRPPEVIVRGPTSLPVRRAAP